MKRTHKRQLALPQARGVAGRSRRAIRRTWRGGWLMVLGLAACDGPIVAGRVDVPMDPGPTRPIDTPVVSVPVERWSTDLPRLVPMAPPSWDPTQDGARCDDPIAIDRGLRGVPLAGGGSGDTCFTGRWPTRYFSLTVAPGELTEITIIKHEPFEDSLWLVAQKGCHGVCEGSWTHTREGLVVHNAESTPVTWVVGARRLEQRTVAGTYDLEVTRRPLVAHALCETALPVEGTTFEVDPQFAGVADDTSYRRALYCRVQVPPMSRATVRPLTSTFNYVFFLDACGGEPRTEMFNPSDEPASALVAAYDVHGFREAPFSAGLEFEPVAAEGFCETPVRLVAGGSVEVDPAMGGPTPAQCWCLTFARVSYVEVIVPPKSELEVVGDTGDPTASITLIDQPAQCSNECGFQPAFGFEGTTSLRVANDSDTPRAVHVLVESRPGWSETSTPEAPPVRLTTRVVDHADGH